MSGGRLIGPHGGYRKLKTYQIAREIYDATVIFCNRFVDKHSRTHDQMVQAGRSGVQNIVEGSIASGTSKKIEIKLTGIAKASLEELLNDYEDFLRQNGLKLWDKESPEAKAVRKKYKERKWGGSDRSDGSDESEESEDFYGIRSATAEVAGNTIICLIHQASFLLRRQLERLEQEFLEGGGFTERMYRERKKWRDKKEEK